MPNGRFPNLRYNEGMDLNHLRTFVIVADEGSVTKAARRLFMTPPTISGHIKLLEESLNVQLFERTPRGMMLTENGRLLKQKAEQTLQAAQDLVNHATSLQTHLLGTVRLGINASPTLLKIGALTAVLNEQYPGITLQLQTAATGNISPFLCQKQLDLGFIFGKVASAELVSVELGQIPLAIAVPNGVSLPAKQTLWADLAQLPWIYTDVACPFQNLVDDQLSQRSLSVSKKVIANDEQTRLELVKAGLGASLLIRQEAEANSSSLQLIEETLFSLPLSIVALKSRQADPLIQPVLQAICATWQ